MSSRNRCSGSSTYLALGRGTEGTLGACLSGLWSAGVDMFRCCTLILSCTVRLGLKVAADEPRWTEGERESCRRAVLRKGSPGLCMFTSRRSIRDKVEGLGFGIISREWSRQWVWARHGVRFVKVSGRGEMPRL
jgi:hypothetical protein